MRSVFLILLSISNAWPLVLKRGVSHWQLLSSVITGVLIASAILSGTVIYFDSLKELALQNSLDKLTPTETNILIKAVRGPSNLDEYGKVANIVTNRIDSNINWLLEDIKHGGKTATFYMSPPGQESNASNDNARAFFAFLPELSSNITINPGGKMPAEPTQIPTAGIPLSIEAIIPADAAELFGLKEGDHLSAIPFWAEKNFYADVTVTGIFHRDNPENAIWSISDNIFASATKGDFRTIPLYISEDSYLSFLGETFTNMDSSYVWLLDIDRSKLDASNAGQALTNMISMEKGLSSLIRSYRQYTSLDETIIKYDQTLFYSKAPMFMVFILIGSVILYYLITLSSMLVEQQESETSLLRSRGASSLQILSVFAIQGASICLIAIILGPIFSSIIIALLGYTPAFSDLTGGSALTTRISLGAIGMSTVSGLLSFAAVMVPAIQVSNLSIVKRIQYKSRPIGKSFFHRYYIDILLLVTAVLLFREMTEHGSAIARDVFGVESVDHLKTAVPALILISSAMILLRLFPLFMSLLSKLLSNLLPSSIAIAVWQIARNPKHYARLSLMLVLVSGLGIFAASFGATLDKSFVDRTMYLTGADLRLTGLTLGEKGSSTELRYEYSKLPGVKNTSPIYRGIGSDRSRLLGGSYDILAMDSEQISQIGYFREDFTNTPFDDLVRDLSEFDLPDKIEIPDEASKILIKVKPDRPHRSILIDARILDSKGRYFSNCFGSLYFIGWTELSSDLKQPKNCFGGVSKLVPEPPLSLVSITVHERNGLKKLSKGSVLISKISALNKDGDKFEIEPFENNALWSVLRVAPRSQTDTLIIGDGIEGDMNIAKFTWTEGIANLSRGIHPGPPINPVPVLVNKEFLDSSRHKINDILPISVAGHRFNVKLIDYIHYFPTIDSSSRKRGFLIADLPTLESVANLETTVNDLKPNEIWISANNQDYLLPKLKEHLGQDLPFPSSTVHERSEVLETIRVDPLVKAGWKALLFVALSSVLILSIVGFLLHAYISFKNRSAQFALLRTIGLSKNQLTLSIWLEQAFIIVIGLALGTWMGGRLGATIMPFLGNDQSGKPVIPPFIMEINWPTLFVTYTVMIAIFTLIMLTMIWFVKRIALAKTLRIGEL